MTGIITPIYAGDVAGGVVDLADDEIDGVRNAHWKLGADGFTYRNGTKGFTWLNPQTGMDQYEILVDLGVGADPLTLNAGLGAWLSPVLNPEWGYGGAGDAATGSIDVQIRQVSDGSVVDTATITLTTEGTISGGGVPRYPGDGNPNNVSQA
jgi:hypothetical protein